MKNHLIYARESKEMSACDQIEMLEEYAKFQRWNVVGHVADKITPLMCDTDADFENLCHYLEKHTDIDVVVTSEVQNHSWVDSSAIKAILDRKKIKLITISICPEDGD